jgi:hypothetical protein
MPCSFIFRIVKNPYEFDRITRNQVRFSKKHFWKGSAVKVILPAALVILIAVPAFGQVAKDADSYCAYVTEQAQSQKTLYRMPNLEAGVSQPTQAVPAETFAGVTSGLSNFRKSQLVGPAANDTCQLYRATIEAQERISYALPSIERDALAKRLTLTSQAIEDLGDLIAQNQKKVNARDATLDTLYLLQSAKAKLEADRGAAELTLSTLAVPVLSEEPLKNLAAVKQSLELKTQEASAKLSKQDNWDVTVMVGIRHNAAPFFSTPPGAYGGFDARWNIGSWKRDHELDQTADDYAEWKRQQDSDVVHSMAQLRQQIISAIEAQERALAAMQASDDLIGSNREKIKGVDTAAALLFDNQLVADELSLRVEIGTTQFRLLRLKQYLADNF